MWAVSVILGIPAALVCFVNAQIFFKYELAGKKAPSYIPFLGAILGFFALRACPVPVISKWAWIAVFLDLGTALPAFYLLILIVKLPWKIAARKDESHDRPACDSILQDRFRGVILGTAVGDSLGLPAEGLSPARARKLFGREWRHRFIFGRGMTSDDTEHTVFVAQGLLAHPSSAENFAKRLARCFRWWLVSLPAGIGWATLRSIVRLWVGVSPAKSGVYSAGNGPAMRAAPLGAFFASPGEQMDAYLRASTMITHTDPRALTGSRAVAYLVSWCLREGQAARPEPGAFAGILEAAGAGDAQWESIVGKIKAACEKNLPVEQFAEELGLSRGVTGYVYHTVPVAVYAWFRHYGDFRQTLESVLNCGGDTDTAGAIAGALAGAAAGESGIPREWVEGIVEWPRDVNFLRRLSDRLLECSRDSRECLPVQYFWPGTVLRNLVFLVIVLLHGFRRLAPPY